jgi:hypothetical protein
VVNNKGNGRSGLRFDLKTERENENENEREKDKKRIKKEKTKKNRRKLFCCTGKILKIGQEKYNVPGFTRVDNFSIKILCVELDGRACNSGDTDGKKKF